MFCYFTLCIYWLLKLFGFQICLGSRVSDKGYYRDALCALNLISTFLFWKITGPSLMFRPIPLHTTMFDPPMSIFPWYMHQNSVHHTLVRPLICGANIISTFIWADYISPLLLKPVLALHSPLHSWRWWTCKDIKGRLAGRRHLILLSIKRRRTVQ